MKTKVYLCKFHGDIAFVNTMIRGNVVPLFFVDKMVNNKEITYVMSKYFLKKEYVYIGEFE